MRRARALGWTQNAYARAAKKDPGFVSRLFRGIYKAPGVYRELVQVLERGEAGDPVVLQRARKKSKKRSR